MKSARRECTAILWREGSNKIEKSETESSVSMQGTRLYWQSFEERLQSDTRTGWMTGCCTAKNSRTAWVRGCRRTSWIAEEKKNSRKEKRHERNRIKNDEVENYYAWMRTAKETAEEKEICLSKRRSRDYKNRFEEMKSTRRECTALLWREGSNKIEKSETESSVSMQGTQLYWQSFEERLQSETRTGWMTGCCTAKNSRTAWVRGCRRTSWKTWGRKTKYSGTNTVKVKMHGKTKTVAQIESRKTAGSLPLIYCVICLTFYLKIFPWIKCMFSPVVFLCI